MPRLQIYVKLISCLVLALPASLFASKSLPLHCELSSIEGIEWSLEDLNTLVSPLKPGVSATKGFATANLINESDLYSNETTPLMGTVPTSCLLKNKKAEKFKVGNNWILLLPLDPVCHPSCMGSAEYKKRMADTNRTDLKTLESIGVLQKKPILFENGLMPSTGDKIICPENLNWILPTTMFYDPSIRYRANSPEAEKKDVHFDPRSLLYEALAEADPRRRRTKEEIRELISTITNGLNQNLATAEKISFKKDELKQIVEDFYNYPLTVFSSKPDPFNVAPDTQNNDKKTDVKKKFLAHFLPEKYANVIDAKISPTFNPNSRTVGGTLEVKSGVVSVKVCRDFYTAGNKALGSSCSDTVAVNIQPFSVEVASGVFASAGGYVNHGTDGSFSGSGEVRLRILLGVLPKSEQRRL